jgi:V/A-type H+-transporting ATPase subunit E
MQDLQPIIQKILDDGKKEAEAIVSRARAKSEEIISEGVKIAEDNIKEARLKAAGDAETIKKTMISSAHMEGRKKVLMTKQQIIKQTVEKAINVIMDMPEEQYIDFVASLVLAVPDLNGKINAVFSKRDKQQYAQAICSRVNTQLLEKGIPAVLEVSSEDRDIKGGVILIKDNIEINYSIDALVRAKYDELTAVAAAILF